MVLLDAKMFRFSSLRSFWSELGRQRYKRANGRSISNVSVTHSSIALQCSAAGAGYSQSTVGLPTTGSNATTKQRLLPQKCLQAPKLQCPSLLPHFCSLRKLFKSFLIHFLHLGIRVRSQSTVCAISGLLH